MFRFTDFINANDQIAEVVARYPTTREIFEANGVRRCCWECAVRTAAWRGGIELSSLLDELNRAALNRAGESAESRV